MNDYIKIDKEVQKHIKEIFSDIFICANDTFVQLRVVNEKTSIHYELYEGQIQLHFEWGSIGNWALRNYLQSMTKMKGEIKWDKWQGRDKCRAILQREITDFDSLDSAIMEMRNLFDTLVISYNLPQYCNKVEQESTHAITGSSISLPNSETELIPDEKEPVSLYEMSLLEIFNLPLYIPDYQRIYCWRKKNVQRLLFDVFEAKAEYKLGCIILQRTNISNIEKYDIIDGQQRLVTLAMLFNALGVCNINLLNRSFESKESNEYVAFNKHLISSFLNNRGTIDIEATIELMKRLSFSVLVLNDKSIDLAYTFFSNQNSKGKQLSDYDLLKAHHLRFIESSDIQYSDAKRWNDMLLSAEDNKSEKTYVRTLDTYLFRLRQWLCFNYWNEQEPFRIKNEYEASDHLMDLFGNQNFSANESTFHESICGGEYFFDYTDHYISKYKEFVNTDEYDLLHESLSRESHWRYRDVIEALLFEYFLKFGNSYLPEATILLSRLISIERLSGKRANFDRLLLDIGDKRIACWIDSAKNPSILFQQLINNILSSGKVMGSSQIQKRYANYLNGLLQSLSDTVTLESVKHFCRI